jgi:hypothetical protein
MIEPPDAHEDKPHKIGKHYYMMYAEIVGKVFLHDEYCALAYWMISKIHEANGGTFEH